MNIELSVRDEYPCLCGCGKTTQRRFFPGHDSAFYRDLRLKIAGGDAAAKKLYDFIFKNNKKRSFPKQREMAAEYLKMNQSR